MRRLLAIAVIALAACDSESTPPFPGPTGGVSTPTSARAGGQGSGDKVFDPLTIELVLESTTVHSGGELTSRFTVENMSGHTIIDPSCRLGAGAYALIPADEPDAELWLQPVVDCGGDFEMPDSFRDGWKGPTFPARSMQGAFLPPGDYIAALKITGRTGRIEIPVTVTER